MPTKQRPTANKIFAPFRDKNLKRQPKIDIEIPRYLILFKYLPLII
tara:strand:- start:1035 stop:1172 length:138 start_codon:yes stop_codon:yes gene_type:complete